MTNREKIDEMIRQLNTSHSKKKKRQLRKGIERAERQRRKEKLEREGIIIIQ